MSDGCEKLVLFAVVLSVQVRSHGKHNKYEGTAFSHPRRGVYLCQTAYFEFRVRGSS